MDLEGSLPYIQQLVAGPHTEPDESNPYPHILFRSIFSGIEEPGYLSRYSDGLGRPGFDSRQRQEIYFSSTASRPALETTQQPIQLVRGALSPGGKAAGT
jgi:hypothetical protein